MGRPYYSATMIRTWKILYFLRDFLSIGKQNRSRWCSAAFVMGRPGRWKLPVR